ncbi:hypothetical protein ACJX0J_027043, partial [Zea mays]
KVPQLLPHFANYVFDLLMSALTDQFCDFDFSGSQFLLEENMEPILCTQPRRSLKCVLDSVIETKLLSCHDKVCKSMDFGSQAAPPKVIIVKFGILLSTIFPFF